MTGFEYALTKLKQGYKMTRPVWSHRIKFWLEYDKETNVIWYCTEGHESRWNLTQADILANDWEAMY